MTARCPPSASDPPTSRAKLSPLRPPVTAHPRFEHARQGFSLNLGVPSCQNHEATGPALLQCLGAPLRLEAAALGVARILSVRKNDGSTSNRWIEIRPSVPSAASSPARIPCRASPRQSHATLLSIDYFRCMHVLVPCPGEIPRSRDRYGFAKAITRFKHAVNNYLCIIRPPVARPRPQRLLYRPRGTAPGPISHSHALRSRRARMHAVQGAEARTRVERVNSRQCLSWTVPGDVHGFPHARSANAFSVSITCVRVCASRGCNVLPAAARARPYKAPCARHSAPLPILNGAALRPPLPRPIQPESPGAHGAASRGRGRLTTYPADVRLVRTCAHVQPLRNAAAGFARESGRARRVARTWSRRHCAPAPLTRSAVQVGARVWARLNIEGEVSWGQALILKGLAYISTVSRPLRRRRH